MSISRAHLLAFPLLLVLVDCSRARPAWTQDPPLTHVDSSVETGVAREKQDHLLAGSAVVGGSYVLMGAYAYYSWYLTEDQVGFFVTDDGWFGKDTYAGGTDKIGHSFANYVITRTGYDVLSWAGLSRNKALATSIGLDALFFTAIEIKDGYTSNLGFSWGDIVSNLFGNLLAAAFVLHPSLDRSFDFRLEYYPSEEYIAAAKDSGTVNAVEDYTGMTYGLWYHLGEVPGLSKLPVLAWLRFLDVGVTYGSRYYRPRPSDGRPPEQELSVALTLDVAAIVRALAGDRAPGVVRTSDWVFEYFTIPKTTLKAR